MSPELEKVISDLRIEIGKLIGFIEKLREEIKPEKLERNRLKGLLFDLKPILLSFKNSLSNFLVLAGEEDIKRKSASEPLLLLFEAIVNINVKQKILQEIEGCISQISYCASYEIDKPEYYKDSDIKNKIYNFITYLESIFSIFDREIFRPLSLSITGFSKLVELTTEEPMGLNENWAAANCYLSAMEIVVNKKRKEMGLEGEKEFNKKFKELIGSLEKKGISIGVLEKELPSVFWKIRNDVIHEGYSPKHEELDLITIWSKKIINILIKS